MFQILCAGLAVLMTQPAFSAEPDLSGDVVYRQTEVPLSATAAVIPIHHWHNPSLPVRAIVVAVHGVTLHGGTYDKIARELAEQGIVTIAQDMRGFGRCRGADQQSVSMRRVNYKQSLQDLVALLRKVRIANPGVPIYCMGESLGANAALWLAGKHPELTDGIIISSLCVKRYWNLSPYMVKDMATGLFMPARQISMAPYVQKFLSHNQEVTSGYASDNQIRKTLSLTELLQSVLTNRRTLAGARKIPRDMPILVVEGTNDLMYHSDSILKVMDRVPSCQQRIYWAKDRGHLLLETAHVDSDILQAVSGWVTEQAGNHGGIALRVSTGGN